MRSLMFRMLVLQALNNLSDEQVEYIRRATGCRSRAFWGSRSRTAFRKRHDALAVPGRSWPGPGYRLWRGIHRANHREFEKLFDPLSTSILRPRATWRVAGNIIDASIVLVPTQRNSRDKNAELQAGRTTAGVESRSPPKCGRRTAMRAGPEKHGRSFFVYKNHVNADAKHKLIRHYALTDAAVHDSQELDRAVGHGQHLQ